MIWFLFTTMFSTRRKHPWMLTYFIFFNGGRFLRQWLSALEASDKKSRLLILHTSLKGYSSTMRSTLKATLKASVLPSTIPHICPFWNTTTLFRFVKNTPNLRKFAFIFPIIKFILTSYFNYLPTGALCTSILPFWWNTNLNILHLVGWRF